jgi:uncharacterized protein
MSRFIAYVPSTRGLPMLLPAMVLAACGGRNVGGQPPATAAEKIVIERNVEIPMRDGTILRADVLRPAEGGPYPVLFLRTPYGKGPRYREFAEAGYIVVNQDARGRYASDGEYESYYRPKSHCADDGFDSIAWCAKLAGSDGRVGSFGVSYNALLQWKTASARPPALGAMAAFSIPARHVDLEGPGGIRPGRRLRWWYGTMSSDLRRRHGLPGPHDPKVANAILAESLNEHLTWWLPWGELPDDVLTTEKQAVLDYMRAPHEDMWKLDECAARATAPNLNVCGWYDHCNGSIDLHTAIAGRDSTEKARNESKLIVGPWSHHTLGKRATNGFDFGPEAAMDLTALQLRWFDRHLKGRDTGIEKDAPVRIFVMGANRWRDEKVWPPARAKPVRMYLASGGKANGPLEAGAAAGGRLLEQAAAEEATDRYDYDPRDPVPSMFGAETYTVPVDQRKVAHRRDVLFYESEPLEKPLEVIGYPECELFAATSAADTDFIVKLVDVAPDGTARDISTGIVRARYRDGVDRPPRDLKPGEVTTYAIRMKPTAMEFQPRHRIRVQVTSSDFPSFDRNHNTGVNQNFDAELVTARQTVFHGGERASCVVLPVISGD